MSRSKLTECKPINFGTDVYAYSIDEFCALFRISRQLYYKLKAKGLMPATIKLGTRVLITRAAATAWLEQKEQAAKIAQVQS